MVSPVRHERYQFSSHKNRTDERHIRQMLPEIPHARLGGSVVVPIDLLRQWLRDQANSEPRKANRIAREAAGELGIEYGSTDEGEG